VPTVPVGKECVDTDNGGGGLMVILRVWLTEFPVESVTCMVKVEVPSAVGVPWTEMDAAVLVDKDKPAGKVPEVRTQVKVPVAPVALITP